MPIRVRLASVLLLLATPGCVFYTSEEDDQPPPFADASWWSTDAWREQIDASPPDAEPSPVSCSEPLACPGASPNKVTVCGRLYDVETDAQIRAVTESTGECGPLGASGGACNLQVQLYDAIDFAANPAAAVPLPVEDLRLDDCGRFVARNVTRPSLGFVGVAVDDADAAPDLRRLTGVAMPATSGQTIRNLRAYSIRRSTDEGWTGTAGLSGATFVDRGVIWKLFRDGNAPVAGVQITGVNAATRPADDYYFSDVGAFNRISIAPGLTATGANGSALMLNSGLVEHSGTGGERDMCEWSSDLAAAIPGVLFVAPSSLQGAGGQACP